MELRSIFNELMRKHHRQSILLGGTSASSPEEFFGFEHGQVKAVHFHKQGHGRGVWFRLQCGRVVDEAARTCARDPGLYDHAMA
jgi:hypothetical protein